ncbi:MAG: hypothetical protein NTY32_01625 [Bacteroidia bacterium]|nr:hypothetical protein [Bacteroidia bacterium]
MTVIGMQSCVKDPLEDVTKGGWNHERTVISIMFENQVGKAIIENTDATTGVITLAINVSEIPDLSNVKLSKLETSYQAISSIAIGQSMNFQNDTKTGIITITSTTGQKRDYTIYVTEFNETILGVWDIKALTVYGGTGPEYGGSAVLQLMDKPWIWSSVYSPATECDNTLTFTLDSISEVGNTYGKVVNNPGVDGKYADFIFIGDNPENPGITVDVTGLYRQIPKGTGYWMRDYAKLTVLFTASIGKITTGTFVAAGTENLGNGKTMTITNNAFAFNLNGTDDWGNIYKDYDKFVKKPRRYWISVTKQ